MVPTNLHIAMSSRRSDQPALNQTNSNTAARCGDGEQSSHAGYLAKCIPAKLPFPRERLDGGGLLCNAGREQFMDWNGSFVLTAVDKLPAGGQHVDFKVTTPALQTVLLGDIGARSKGREQVLRQVEQLNQKSSNDHLTFGLGDWLYPYGPVSDSTAETLRVKKGVLEAFDNKSLMKPMFGVLGNHEYGTLEAACDPARFMQLANAANIQFPGRYYSMTIEGPDWSADCFALDTSTLACDPDQVHWLQQAVAQSKAAATPDRTRWRIIMAHHPLVSYGVHQGENQFMAELLGECLRDIHLYCCGHEHDMEYIHTGADLPPVLLSGTASERRHTSAGAHSLFSDNQYGFASLTIDRKKIEVRIFDASQTQPVYETQIGPDR